MNDQNPHQNETIAVVGLGYVGLPLATLLSTKYSVIGFDVSEVRIAELQSGYDRTNEVENVVKDITYTNDATMLNRASFIVVTVPTPIDAAKNPDLSPLISATETVGSHLQKGAVVVYESTVYPGCTEEICVPILERQSGLKFNNDFTVGYSPERVNPGDREHTIDKVVKVISGSTSEATDRVAGVYGSVVTAGIHRASSLKVAEAAKVIENIKRDINIALVNELSLIFEKIDIDTREVLAAASTKWNFNSGTFMPGLVGGHCISVDPYYLTHKSLELGHHPQMILAGRAINEYMARHVADTLIKELSVQGKALRDCRVLVMGLSFKENVPDTRNSQAQRIIGFLREFSVHIDGCDPLLQAETISRYFDIPSVSLDAMRQQYDAVLVFSPHDIFKSLTLEQMKQFVTSSPILFDLKRMFDKSKAVEQGFIYKTL